MKGKELKQAKLFQVKLDTVRPYTFDFNTLAELQEIGFEDPYSAISGLEMMHLKAIKALLFAGLVAGQMAEDESVEFELSHNKVGQVLGQLMSQDPEGFQEVFKVIGSSIAEFFPDPEKKTDEEVAEVETKND